MNNTKHTPGPWKSNPYVHSMIHGFAVYSDKSCVDKIADDIKREADARLIAAAPEMLEALKEALLDLESLEGETKDDLCLTRIEQIKAAIAKATGGERE